MSRLSNVVAFPQHRLRNKMLDKYGEVIIKTQTEWELDYIIGTFEECDRLSKENEELRSKIKMLEKGLQTQSHLV